MRVFHPPSSPSLSSLFRASGAGPHYDTTSNDPFNNRRVATWLVYLQGVKKGGQTVFPLLSASSESKHVTPSSSEHGMALARERFEPACRGKGRGSDAVVVQPQKGMAVLFFPVDPRTKEIDRRMVHGACPVKSNTKWIMQQWVHEDVFVPSLEKSVLALFPWPQKTIAQARPRMPRGTCVTCASLSSMRTPWQPDVCSPSGRGGCANTRK